MNKCRYLLSIITVTHCAHDTLLELLHRLERSLSADIRWIIKDSSACPKTREWASFLTNPYIHFYAKPDSGIYQAINQALTLTNSDFYIIVGADDYLYHDSLHKLINILRLQNPLATDIFVFPVRTDNHIIRPVTWFPTSVSVRGLVSSHSAGTVFPTVIHEKYGMYDESFKILADSLFIKQLFIEGVRFHYYEDLILGFFSRGGISSSNHSVRILEAYNYNILTGSPLVQQAILLFFRIIKYQVLYLSR